MCVKCVEIKRKAKIPMYYYRYRDQINGKNPGKTSMTGREEQTHFVIPCTKNQNQKGSCKQSKQLVLWHISLYLELETTQQKLFTLGWKVHKYNRRGLLVTHWQQLPTDWMCLEYSAWIQEKQRAIGLWECVQTSGVHTTYTCKLNQTNQLALLLIWNTFLLQCMGKP